MELDVSAIFPPNVPVFRCSLPSTGSLGFWFPCFHGTVEHSDFLPPLPRCFVSFASRYRHAPWTSLPQLQDATAASQGLFTGLPHTGSIGGGDRTSQVPGEPHYERALLFDPGGTSALGPYCASMLPSAFLTASAPAIRYFGAQSHGPLTRCLRFAGWVTPPPRKTRFRMAGRPFRAGLTTRWVPMKGFKSSHSPFPDFAWRTRKSP